MFINNFLPPSNDLILGGSTIVTEMNFYLILPLLFLFINNYYKAIFFSLFYLILIFSLNEFSYFFFNGKVYGEANFYRTIFVQLYVFSLGLTFFNIFKDYLVHDSKVKKIYLKEVIIKCFPILMISFLMYLIGKPSAEYLYFRNMLLVSNLFFLMVTFLFIINKKIKFNLFFNFFVRLGKISFSMYILHWITIHFSWILLSNLDYFNYFLPFFLIISFSFTYFCSYYFSKLEYFFINFGKKLTNFNSIK